MMVCHFMLILRKCACSCSSNASLYTDSRDPCAVNSTFHLLTQSRYADPPDFTLNFKVLFAPPTDITCQVDGDPVDVVTLAREIIAANYVPTSDGSSPITSVTVTLRTRQAGNYTCTVSVFRASKSNLADAMTPPICIEGWLTVYDCMIHYYT